MRVAHLMAGSRAGGAELFFERLNAAMARAGDEVLPVIRREAGRAARLRASGLAPVELGFGGALDWRTRPAMRRALRRFRPAVAVAWMGRAARFAPRGDWVLAGRLGGYYDLGRFRACDHLIGNTRHLVDWMARQGWPEARCHFLPNFSPDLLGAPPDRAGAPPGRPLVLAMGRLHPNKGFDTLLEAVARLPDAALVLAGAGPDEAALRARAGRLGIAPRVRFAGWREDGASLLAACDVLVCPSRHEPLGNVVLEAFSAARPVVASASFGPAALIETGRTGLLVPVDDAVALADAIGEVLADTALASRLAKAGRAEYETSHAEAPVLAAWRRALTRIVEEGGRT